MRDLQIADKLRAYDLKVVEVAGWKTRGNENFNPMGFVWHHTAGGPKGNAPSLGVVTNGRKDLPGPLANVFQARDNTVYVVAAGRANHAGPGGWKGLSGNSSVYGLEIENVGTAAEPLRPDQIETAYKVAAALTKDPRLCCHHKEWAPKRKIDVYGLNGDDSRLRVTQLMEDKGEDMTNYVKLIQTGEYYALNFEHYRKLTPKQFKKRQDLSALGGKTIAATDMHAWAFAGFVANFDLIALPPTRDPK